MADDTHLAVLKQGVAAWNEWRAAHAAARPDFSSASLRGLDLAKVDFAEANLRKADLRGTTLSGAVLIAADLADANFFKAALNGANLFAAKSHWCAVPQLRAARCHAELAIGLPGSGPCLRCPHSSGSQPIVNGAWQWMVAPLAARQHLAWRNLQYSGHTIW